MIHTGFRLMLAARLLEQTAVCEYEIVVSYDQWRIRVTCQHRTIDKTHHAQHRIPLEFNRSVRWSVATRLGTMCNQGDVHAHPRGRQGQESCRIARDMMLLGSVTC